MSTVGYGDLTIAGGSDPETWRLLIGAIYMPVSFSFGIEYPHDRTSHILNSHALCVLISFLLHMHTWPNIETNKNVKLYS